MTLINNLPTAEWGRGKSPERRELYVLKVVRWWPGGWAGPSGLQVLGLQPLPAPGFHQSRVSSLGTGTRCQGLTCGGTLHYNYKFTFQIKSHKSFEIEPGWF